MFSKSSSLRLGAALLLPLSLAACGGAGDSAPSSLMGMSKTTVGRTQPVNLGTAGNFAILAKSGISTVPRSAVTGDIGVSPIAATAITGFSLIASPGNVYSTSAQVTGRVYAASYAVPTPSNLTTAVRKSSPNPVLKACA